MSERKVLNKYYPPDFDPSKIPRAKQSRNKKFTVRLMAPCNMRCNTCSEYIYKGKKFNARKEDVEDETYMGLRIYRFYFKCPRCLAEISFKTDLENTDYVIEAGATRNFMALKLAEEQAEREERERIEEEASNPMKLLESRTKQSRNEMASLEALEELREMNQRLLKPDYETMLGKYEQLREDEKKKQEEEDDRIVKSVFGTQSVKRIEDDSSSDSDSDSKPKAKKYIKLDGNSKSTNTLIDDQPQKPMQATWNKSVGSLSRNKLVLLVKPKEKSAIRTLQKELNSSLDQSKEVANSTQQIKASNSLSLVGQYSDSSDEDCKV